MQINTIINYIYATKHGYDFIMINEPIIIDNYITYYDYLLIIDNSNIININYNIQDFINNNNEDIIVINDKNYLIKNNNNKTKITKNITNEIWFNKNISYSLLNELLLKFNYINDIYFDINTINDNINIMNKKICNNINKKSLIHYKYNKNIIFYIIFIIFIIYILYLS